MLGKAIVKCTLASSVLWVAPLGWAGITPEAPLEAANEAVEHVAQERPAASSGLADRVESELGAPDTSFPYFEHHGYFRFRADNFWNLDLDTQGTSPILPPLEATPLVQEDIPASFGDYYDSQAELLSSANLRFRYHPIFHISDDARIHLELDILDNVLLGDVPDTYNVFLSEGDTIGGVNGLGLAGNGLQDTIEVRQLYAEMDFLGTVRV
ncbi:MAG: hypothetical protein KC561_19030, partial [Myxococcales bacterium]|nr:hypothetical protein [Myxococcales bacterium]